MAPGVYHLGFVQDLIFSCGWSCSCQWQDKINGEPEFRFLEHVIPKDVARRGVLDTSVSYAYVQQLAGFPRAAISETMGAENALFGAMLLRPKRRKRLPRFLKSAPRIFRRSLERKGGGQPPPLRY
ncbi:hypothetical protein INH39_14655 [Massilia violaceinigra]|uniref:Uncharacterized protein n=1 Tax=Massilia violaceinigra TaxID=2045208 RepID=A0ABY4AF63_9BURK|nr:hypothetical protein [Massilia violaceinigra]UOD32790.1 hypothetical protein INH39_14655 [Massilia violaceinigra]